MLIIRYFRTTAKWVSGLQGSLRVVFFEDSRVCKGDLPGLAAGHIPLTTAVGALKRKAGRTPDGADALKSSFFAPALPKGK